MASQGRFKYRISVQTVLPPDYATSESFRRVAEGLRRLGLWGLELNVQNLEDPRTRDLSAIRTFLAEFDLELSMFASGLTAKTLGLSLSAVTETKRREAVDGTKAMIDWVAAQRAESPERAETPIGIIIGFLKGGIASRPIDARRSMIESLTELAPYASKAGVPLILEATNRYESSVVNSIEEGIGIIDEAVRAANGEGPGTVLQLLPDTFHMNIEEKDMVGAMRKGLAYFTSFHLSDNNRCFPGYGAIDFKKVLGGLDGLGYRGRLAIEGNVKKDLVSDLTHTIEYLSPFIED